METKDLIAKAELFGEVINELNSKHVFEAVEKVAGITYDEFMTLVHHFSGKKDESGA